MDKDEYLQTARQAIGTSTAKNISSVALADLYYLVNSTSILTSDERAELKSEISSETPAERLSEIFNNLLTAEINFLSETLITLNNSFKLAPGDLELPQVIKSYSDRLSILTNLTTSGEITRSFPVLNI